MERLKITLVGLVLVLTLVVAYGYGCGDSNEDSGGGTDSVAAEADGGGGDGTSGATDGGEATTDGGGASDGGDGTAGDETGGDSTGGDSTGRSDGTGDSGDSDSDGGGSAGASGAPLSKPQFIEQGDAICEKVPAKYGKIVADTSKEAQKNKEKPPSTAEVNLKAAVPPLPEAAEELEGLVPPKGDEQEAEAIVAALEAAAKGLEEKPSSPLSGPQSPFDEFQKLTRKYGFTVCSGL